MARFKGLRLHQEMLQADVAERLGINQSQYSKLERDALEPNLETIRSLARLFNVSADYLLEIDNSLDYEPTFDLCDFLRNGKLTLDGQYIEPRDCEYISDMVHIFMAKRRDDIKR
ncbi:helix-turn-helix domain-containing protein [Selenomonas ruminantium]|uniref:helix-turn-helix domain-containing protein n=1 Tax=Selenomonas ruminantium TaxID=971 RepID=UPI000684CE22|nr:helix-turn-helix transcriptional regulator [Selenomonas ruminantium]